MRELRSQHVGRPLLIAILALVCLSACGEQVNDFLRVDRFQSAKSGPSLAYLSASSDLIDVSNATGLTINGTCSAEGKPVVISGAASTIATCTGGAWSAVVDASAASDGLLTFTVDHSDAQGNRATPVTVKFPKDTGSTFATFTKSDARITESNTSSSFTIQLSAAKLYDTVLNYVVSGSATAGTDHNLTNGTVTIPAGQTSATVNFNILNNGVVQNERRLAISLSQSNRASVLLGAVSDFFLDIADDDSGAYHAGIISYAGTSGSMCVVYSDNKIKCWGSNQFGEVGDGTLTARQTPVATDAATSYTKVVGGGGPSNCALTLAGTIKCWGYNGGGQLGDGTTTNRLSPVLANGGATFLSISGGSGAHYCAITTANKLNCWGSNPNGQVGDGSTTQRNSAVAVDAASNYAKVSVGRNHSCGITSLGVLKCWGSNSDGQLGDGTTTQRLSPVIIDAGTSYASVAAGPYHSCGLTTTGLVKCWGLNTFGQLGDGTTAQRLSPVAVDAAVTYAVIDASRDTNGTTCGITTTGALKCWGANQNYGLVGDGTLTNRPTPVLVDAGTTYSSVNLANYNACALTTGGTLKCWGSGATEQFAQPYLAQSELLPVAPQPGIVYSALARGATHSCGILSTGKMRCWGGNSYGQLGDGSTNLRASPVDVDSTTTFTKVSAGAGHTCALTNLGKMKCWGRNAAGQLGDGTTTDRVRPVAVNAATVYTTVVARDDSTCGITQAGVLQCWGYNAYGQLGDGSATNRSSAVIVDSGTSYKAVSIGFQNTCAVTVGKVLKCWGRNNYGQIGDGTTNASLVPVIIDPGVAYAMVSVSDFFPFEQSTCAVTDVGVLKCWGNNNYYQLGDNTTTQRTSPVVVDAGTSYSSVSETYGTGCATTTAGVVKCWGYGLEGQIGNGLATSAHTPAIIDGGTTYASIAISGETTCGLTSAGALKCWGATAGGTFGRGDRLLVPTAVARILEP